MVRTYKRKTTRGEWSETNMQSAVNDVLRGNLSCMAAAATYSVPRTTLQRKIKEYKSTQCIQSKRLGYFKPVFSQAQEDELASYIKNMEARLFGLSSKEVRELAFQLAERKYIPHNFDRTLGAAGEDWLVNFLKLNPFLSLRKPEATSAARAMGFNRESVATFFKLLVETVEKYKITSNRLFNVDETGMTTVAKSLGKFLATKGKKQVGSLSSAERGQLFTVEICMGADGSYMPPLFIFPRMRMKAELLDGAPPNSWAECNEKGWMTKDIFIKWFRKFVIWSRATKEEPILLLLDGHATHIKSLELIDIARESGVIILCFPPHCTHRLQPLDVSFMKPLSSYYGEEVKKWLRNNPGRIVSHYQVASLFSNAYLKAATMSVAVNGFRKTGIWLINSDVFRDEDFLGSDTTDLLLDNENPSQPVAQSPLYTPPELQSRPLTLSPHIQMQPSTLNPPTPPPGPSTSFSYFSPENILPIPKSQTKRSGSRKRGKTAVITSSPYKKELEHIQAKALTAKNTKKQGRKKCKKDKENESNIEDAQCLESGIRNQRRVGSLACVCVIDGLIAHVPMKMIMMISRTISALLVQQFSLCLLCPR